MDRNFLLSQLPPVLDSWVKVADDQSVPDIIKEIIAAHYANAKDYDRIAMYFDDHTVKGICDKIYEFESENITYREETRNEQTTAIPGGILQRGYGDCKHFAGFAGGILDGIKRATGKKIDWCYRFASYQLLQPMPYHVFIVVFDRENELWIDATPGAEGKTPVWLQDERTSIMPLYRQIAGADIIVDDVDEGADVPVELIQPIQLLMSLGVVAPTGAFNDARYKFLNTVLPDPRRQAMSAALQSLIAANGSTVGNFFDDAFKGVQHFAAGMGMQVPRASFLILVRMNAFGYANKLDKAMQYDDTNAKLFDIWWRLGGSPPALRDAIADGRTKPAATQVQGDNTTQLKELALAGGTYADANGILHDINTGAVVSGIGCCEFPDDGGAVGIVPVIAAAIISSATIVITAMIPIISKLLDKHTTTAPGLPTDPKTGLPVGYNAENSLQTILHNYPIPIAVGAGVLLYYIYKNS